MEVTLEKYELMMAGFVGVIRQAESMAKGSKDKVMKADPFQVHNVGAQGEVAFAKAMNLFWPGHFNYFTGPDIGKSIQIRTATQKPDSPYQPDLPIRPRDKDDDVFVLVIASPPQFKVAGWCYGREGPELGKKANPNGGSPAYFVPVDKLRPIDTLPPESLGR